MQDSISPRRGLALGDLAWPLRLLADRKKQHAVTEQNLAGEFAALVGFDHVTGDRIQRGQWPVLASYAYTTCGCAGVSKVSYAERNRLWAGYFNNQRISYPQLSAGASEEELLPQVSRMTSGTCRFTISLLDRSLVE